MDDRSHNAYFPLSVYYVLQELRVKTDRLEEVFTSLDERMRGIEAELMKGS